MNVSLYQAAAALDANVRWQEVLAVNLASASIPGFKKQNLSFSAVQAGLAAGASNSSRRALEGTLTTDFSPGETRFTGQPTDMAVEGPGFFEVQLPNGAMAYTRDGEFRLNSQGQLMTKSGGLVLSDGGPIQLDLRNSAPLTVSSDGEISQGTDLKGRLRIVEFSNPNLLTNAGGGNFLATDPGAQAQTAEKSAVRQGYLESANFSPVTEMAGMMTAMRQFESNQRLIQLQDERMSKAIHELSPN